MARAHGGRFPRDEAALLKLPGVGPYTAAAIAAIAFDQPAVVVDANVERVVARLFAVEEPLPAAKPAIRTHAAALMPRARAGDYAQAMMDLGATHCSPKRPACALCPLAAGCAARARGDMEGFPRKALRSARPQRFGAAFYVRRADGVVLVRTRPPKGLLGGMTEFPGSVWSAEFGVESLLNAEPMAARYTLLDAKVEHVFTHFALRLGVYTASAPRGAAAPAGHRWVAEALLDAEALPTVMRKVMAAAKGERLGKRRP